jgi:hypothetical protein
MDIKYKSESINTYFDAVNLKTEENIEFFILIK